MARRHSAAWAVVFGVLLAGVAVSLLTGPGGTALTGPTLTFRLLRIALGVLAGGVLAMTGAALQGLLRNPLVDPFTLGVSGGAALGTSLVLLAGLASSIVSPLAGFAGALLTIMAVYLLARVRGKVTVTGLVLAGVVASFLFSSLVMVVVVLGRRPLGQAVYLLMGHLGVAFTRGSLVLFAGSAAVALAGCGVLLVHARDLDIMAANEEVARSLGVDTQRLTRLVFVVGSVLVGIVVSFTGAISFVGLVVPHVVRMMLGPEHRRVLPASFVFGAGLLLLADVAARNLVPGGLPLSVVTALIGVPFFVYLLRRKL